jgi:hypothetical protein
LAVAVAVALVLVLAEDGLLLAEAAEVVLVVQCIVETLVEAAEAAT